MDEESADWKERLEGELDQLVKARPTAINLAWAVERMYTAWEADFEIALQDLLWLWLKLAKDIESEDIAMNKAMGHAGSALLRDGDTVMTHCNAGALATAGYGTALGVIRAAKSEGKSISVIANETRPLLQGARLTAYELMQDHIPVQVACDNAAGLLMSRGLVDAIIVGADRIASNGDVANKIGTYSLALLAKAHKVPFYVAAPSSTFDLSIHSGDDIPIEVRSETEVTHVEKVKIAPEDVSAYNYAFDITPHSLITAIITEKGLFYPPYKQSITHKLG
jgi:methylthioribose-1-phosphate isomerase